MKYEPGLHITLLGTKHILDNLNNILSGRTFEPGANWIALIHHTWWSIPVPNMSLRDSVVNHLKAIMAPSLGCLIAFYYMACSSGAMGHIKVRLRDFDNKPVTPCINPHNASDTRQPYILNRGSRSRACLRTYNEPGRQVSKQPNFK